MAVNDCIDILLVEDVEADARLTMEILRDSTRTYNCIWAKDGEQAMQALTREGEFHSAPRPDLILLDLNLPKKHGHEVLSEIKSNPLFKSIPVFVLTTSGNEDDITKAYTQFANCYIGKPLVLSEFENALSAVDSAHSDSRFRQP